LAYYTNIVSVIVIFRGNDLEVEVIFIMNNCDRGQIIPEFLTPPIKHDNRKLFVGGLPTKVTKRELKCFFEQFGKVIHSFIVVDKNSYRSRGFGFVIFASEEDATALLKHCLTQSALTLQFTNAKTPHATALLTPVSETASYVYIRGQKCELKVCTPKVHNDGYWNADHRLPRNDNSRYGRDRRQTSSSCNRMYQHHHQPKKNHCIEDHQHAVRNGRQYGVVNERIVHSGHPSLGGQAALSHYLPPQVSNSSQDCNPGFSTGTSSSRYQPQQPGWYAHQPKVNRHGFPTPYNKYPLYGNVASPLDVPQNKMLPQGAAGPSEYYGRMTAPATSHPSANNTSGCLISYEYPCHQHRSHQYILET